MFESTGKLYDICLVYGAQIDMKACTTTNLLNFMYNYNKV